MQGRFRIFRTERQTSGHSMIFQEADMDIIFNMPISIETAGLNVSDLWRRNLRTMIPLSILSEMRRETRRFTGMNCLRNGRIFGIELPGAAGCM